MNNMEKQTEEKVEQEAKQEAELKDEQKGESIDVVGDVNADDLENEKAQILEKTAREYFGSAEDEFNKDRYNSAVVLYFKSLVALIDLFILQKTGDTPSSHTERFRITQEEFSDVYDLLDKDFPFYQNSYFQIMSKELAEVIKNDAKIMAEKTKIEL